MVLDANFAALRPLLFYRIFTDGFFGVGLALSRSGF